MGGPVLMSTLGDSSFQSKATRVLNYTVVIILLLYFGKALFIPMSFGLLLAFICYPASRWLEGKGWSRTISATLLVLLIVSLFIALLWLLGYEMGMLAEHKTAVVAKLSEYSSVMRVWLESKLGITLELQANIFTDLPKTVESNLGGTLNNLLTATSSALVFIILIPVFGVLFLTHRDTFVQVLELLVGEQYKSRLRIILHESLLNYFRFVKGTFFVYCIVGVLNSIGLLLLGIEHAILFGMIAAFMTIIPYVGILISAALPISIALITKDSLWYPAGVIIVFTVVQYLEANLIFPRIVGKQLNLSTWAVLVTIIAGTILWGVSGMILFVPFAGILKIISDNVPEMKALNVLLTRRENKK